jgi:beta-xylosidase
MLALCVLTATVATDVQAHARVRSELADLASARHRLATLNSDVKVTTYVNDVATNHRNDLQTSVASTLGQLVSMERTISGTDALAFLQGINLGTLKTCLGGVQSSFGQIAAHDTSQAAYDISVVAGACSTLAGGSADGLAYPFDFPDPFILPVGGTYFGYATNSVAGNIQIIESSDLTHWIAVGDALPQLPAWATPDETWAPAVLHIGGAFVLYYAVRVAGPGGGQECISEATATQPQGPFIDTSTGPLMCQANLGGSIDPSPFVDTDGTPYLVWKSNGGAGASAVWSEALDPLGTGFAPNTAPTQLLAPDQPWDGGVIEAPDLVESGGRYFLFYSGNSWMGSAYAVGVATCTGPTGPCTEPLSAPILASDAGMEGPGGESVFTDNAGSTWIAFDAWAPNAVGYPNNRSLYLRPLNLSGPTPVVEPAG